MISCSNITVMVSRRKSGVWCVCGVLLAVAVCAAAAVCFTLNKSQNNQEGGNALRLTLRDHLSKENVTSKAAIHLTGTRKSEQTVYETVNSNQQFDIKIGSCPQENIKPQKSLEMLEKSEIPHTEYDTARDLGQSEDTNHTTPNDHPMNQSESFTEKSKPNAPGTIYCLIQEQPKSTKTENDRTIYASVNKVSAGYESAHPQS